MPAPYSPLALANYFLERHAGDIGIEHMKLQKLVYCAHGWWLAYGPDRPIVCERPEVWKYGPVFPSLYRALRPFGRTPIGVPQSSDPFSEPATIDGGDDKAKRLLKWVWNRYGHLSSYALSDMTHKPGTPWYRVAEEHGFVVPEGRTIDDLYVVEEFQSIFRAESHSASG